MEPDRIVKGQDQVHKDLCGSSSKKPALVKAGYFLILAGILLFVLAVFHFPFTFWDQDFKVNWYQRSGLEIVDNKPQYTFSLIQPETGEPGFDELKTLALTKNPAFFSQSPVSELVYLRNFPEGEEFREYLFKEGYKNLGINLMAYEVIPGTRPRNGLIAAVVMVILGILLILQGNGKSSRVAIR